MLKKIKTLIKEERARQAQMLTEIELSRNQMREVIWSQAFHDSIKGKKYLQDLPLHVGGWAGNYSFFYVLNRILMEYKPLSILELGLGESTKFISTYLDNYLLNSSHLIIEHDENWANTFRERFALSSRSEIKLFDLQEKEVKGFQSNTYQGLTDKLEKKFDLYLIDGPFGTDRYSRYDLFGITKNLDLGDEFIIILDDYHRRGEKDTIEDVLAELKSKNIPIYTKKYVGNKSQFLIATEKYKYTTTL